MYVSQPLGGHKYESNYCNRLVCRIVVPITPLDGFERNTLADTYIIIVSNAREAYLFFCKEMREVFYF